jgi:protein-disulfide isomerase/uncharacterized membrane protein
MTDQENQETTAEAQFNPPGWVHTALIIVALFGVGVGGLMTWHHEVQAYGNAPGELVGCTADKAVNCNVVNTSEYSEFLGVPIATWGAGLYALVAWLAFLGLRGQARTLGLIAVLGAGATVYSGFLFYVSKTQIGFVCLWCMRLYAANLALLILPLLGGALRMGPIPRSMLGQTAGHLFIATLLAIGGQQAYHMSLMGSAPKNLDKKVKEGSGDAEEGVLKARSIPATTEKKKKAAIKVGPADAWRGNPNAQVTVVEFADLECAYCKRAAGQFERLYAAYGDRVLFVFKHFPMSTWCNPGVKYNKHGNACRSAYASECAKNQGKFWSFADMAFKNQHSLGRKDLEIYAKEIGLDMAKYKSCMSSKKGKAKVLEDAKLGKSLDVRGTPRIFVNGELYRAGSSAESMAKVIEEKLGANAEEAAYRAQAFKPAEQAIKPLAADVPAMRSIAYGELKFSIDSFEGSLDETGKAVSVVKAVPGIAMSWYAAKDACEAAGKRLCTEREWLTACQGALAQDDDGDKRYADDKMEGSLYPYGPIHRIDRCWDKHAHHGYRPVYTGQHPGCVSADGVYDMTGNVAEWVVDAKGRQILMGGAFDSKADKARCYEYSDVWGKGYAAVSTGFRCCKDGG